MTVFIPNITVYCMLGFATSIVGFFFVHRRDATLSDCISHGALPGISVMIILLHTDDPVLIAVFAMLSAFITMMIYSALFSAMRSDSAIATTLGTMLGLNVFLISMAQRININYSVTTLLLGSSMPGFTKYEVYTVAVVFAIVLIAVIFFYRSICYMVFDLFFAKINRHDAIIIFIIFAILASLVVCIGVTTLGAITMVSLFVTPAAIVNLFCKSFRYALFFTGIIGGLSCIISVMISSVFNAPIGPINAFLLASVFIIYSLVVWKK